MLQHDGPNHLITFCLRRCCKARGCRYITVQGTEAELGQLFFRRCALGTQARRGL